MATISTLFGTFNDEELHALKGAIDEMIVVMEKQDAQRLAMKDILDSTFDTLKIPKKILRKMAKVQYKQSFQEEVAEQSEFESLLDKLRLESRTNEINIYDSLHGTIDFSILKTKGFGKKIQIRL